MSKEKPLILRVQSPEGTKRLEIVPSATTRQLFEAIVDTFNLNSFAFALYRQQNQKDEIPSGNSSTVRSLGIKHGDMVYLAPLNGAVLFKNNTSSGEPMSDTAGPSTSSGSKTAAVPNVSAKVLATAKSNIKEDEVDQMLSKLDGRIERKRDEKLCRHNVNSKCVHCSSLEPFDEAYLKEQNVKHLSFHSYLRKMMSGVDRGKFLALEDISCSIKSGCKDHPPWPKGICSKCQPNAITLNMQAYRHVDNVAFENTNLVEKFLNYWRATGHQRIGYLYGTYEVHSDVPLGIRANVVAIYEPPQDSSRDSIRLLPDEKEAVVNEIATALGLRPVGWIFTDLLPDDIQKGTVKHTRNVESHFLSAQECITAGYFQNKHPNPCKYASSGYFGSKHVTVCVTGDKTNQVHMEGYQVSNQCMALVKDNCLVPTKDVPELGYVRESTDKQYVPDVYYKEKDSYGNEVSRLARPLPVEYLLVDVPASTPVTPVYTFNPDPSKQAFPVENRFIDGHIQDFNALASYLQQFAFDEFYEAICDFHLLIYIATMDMLPMKDSLGPLLEALKKKDEKAATDWSRSEQWATLEQLIAASSPPPSRPGSVASGAVNNSAAPRGGDKWPCPFCTFLNESDVQNCAMCQLPRSQA
ncbi:nuclear protein localization protein 4 homolog [Anthonomus grandis grandis]|uniref:nuclear protein localization protein 4 homolog n=1 Tax=Anthonomus grandis grandis TaxID=2921223 RepID=UPI002165A5FD|nr:nuclear protein localization protein 4 homolog [Anthonomus grandis grandis]